ncbi:hypothetical protein [Streptomyces sp. NPDC001930]|uniref:hypothetical protein n=1 Tax=Streptomyces sp. NPDC001930 TaxID=3364625 RepID=UPI0036B72F8B
MVAADTEAEDSAAEFRAFFERHYVRDASADTYAVVLTGTDGDRSAPRGDFGTTGPE